MAFLSNLSDKIQGYLNSLSKDNEFLQGVPYWASAVVVGFVAILYSGLFERCIQASLWVLKNYPNTYFAFSALCLIGATWVVERFAPAAGGTGVPEVTSVLQLDLEKNRNVIESKLKLRVFWVIIASSLLATLGGGGLGREGPVVHMAACLFFFVGKRLGKIWPMAEHQSWVIAGGAAGVAAAFNAPLAGVVFVLEELAQQHFHRFKTVVISSAIVGGIVSQWLTGRYLYFGYPSLGEVPISSVFWGIAIGVVCAIVSIPFHWMLTERFRKLLAKYFNTRIKLAIGIGFALAAIARFITPKSVGGGVATLQALLFNGTQADWSLFAGRFLSTTLTHITGCAGGFLAPSLSLGGIIGSLFAQLVSYPNHGLLVMVGMAAFLSAIIGAPFTAWVVVMEMTDRHSAIFPLMVASLVSHGLLEIYRSKTRVKEVPDKKD